MAAPRSALWLLEPARAHSRTAAAGANEIQEINTDGGAAPADGCSMAKLGQTIEVPYSADDLFWTILV